MASSFIVPSSKEEVLSTYNFAVIHLRQQYRFRRLGITLGAGVSVPLSYPSWEGLVSRISEHSIFPRNLFGALPEASLSSNTQRIFEFFRKCIPRNTDETDRLYDERVANYWKRILSECLYHDNTGSSKEDNIASHPYLSSLLPIIEQANITVNFNFDDSIEHALDLRNSRALPPRKGRCYEIRWDLAAPIRNDLPTIFHPNGFIPHREHEYSSDNVVFAEDSFLKRMTLGKIGDDSVWINEYINSTYIHVGVSLKDEILKALLQRSWRGAPANVHFQIHYTASATLDIDVKDSIVDANFRVLNLFTMFLGNEGSKSLFDLITMDDKEFHDLAKRNGCELKYVFYVTGAVGAGKTTVVNHFRNLWAMDEWLEPSPPLISRSYDRLNDDEKKEADSWVGNQFYLKNRKILESRESIIIVDRCPLDPITFEISNPASRAKLLASQISPGKSNYNLQSGVIFNLEAEPYELRVRLIRKWKFWSEDIIKRLSTDIKSLYGDMTINLDTKGLTLEEVVRSVAKIVFLDEYRPARLHEKLESIADLR